MMDSESVMRQYFFIFYIVEIMTSRDIFIEFEKNVIKWGKKHQIVEVGEVVISKLGGKRDKKLIISSVQVTVGRNAHNTTHKTLVIQYFGRRINLKGEVIDNLGSGLLIREFRTEDGRSFSYEENGVTETANDSGLSFYIDFDPAAKEKYPKSFSSYSDDAFGFSYYR